ncbi:hypothetical protein OROGR_023635 [Orobanche gracilis]
MTIQKALGCKNNPLAYDVTAACSGFMLGLISAACYIRDTLAYLHKAFQAAHLLRKFMHCIANSIGTSKLRGKVFGLSKVQITRLSIFGPYHIIPCSAQWFSGQLSIPAAGIEINPHHLVHR